MQTIRIADSTLRNSPDSAYSFKEKIEIVKQLDHIGVDVIETAPITNAKTDVLFLHTVAPIIKNSTLSCPTGSQRNPLQAHGRQSSQQKDPACTLCSPRQPFSWSISATKNLT